MSWQKDYVTDFQRKAQIMCRSLTLKKLKQEPLFGQWLFKLALKPDAINILIKDFRYWRKRLTAALQHPSPQTRRAVVTLCGALALES